MAALRALGDFSKPFLDQLRYRVYLLRLMQEIYQQLLLTRCQLADFTGQPLKFFWLHLITYPIDLSRLRIQQYQTVT